MASVLGPAIAGLVIKWTHLPTPVYLLDAAAAIGFICCLLSLRVRRSEHVERGMNLPELAAGFRFVWRNQLILGALSLDLFAVLLGGAVTLLPVYAEDILKVGPSGLGWLRTAPAIGALLLALAQCDVDRFTLPDTELIENVRRELGKVKWQSELKYD